MGGRTDLAQHEAAAALVRNFQITAEGALVRRTGSRFVTEVRDSSVRQYPMPFVFSDKTAYVLEFGERVIRVMTNEGILLQQTLTGVTSNDTTNEFTSVGHGYRDDDGPVRISAESLPPEFDPDTDYFITIPETFSIDAADITPTPTDTFTVAAGHGYSDEMGPFQIVNPIQPPDGIDSSTDYFIVFVSSTVFQLSLIPGGSAETFADAGTGATTIFPTAQYQRNQFGLSLTAGGVPIAFSTAPASVTITPQAPVSPIEITSPYDQDELEAITVQGYAQSADVLYLVHQAHQRRKLTRTSAHGFFMETVEEIDGPYLDENLTDITLDPSATTGNDINITASSPVFNSGDFGRHIRILQGTQWGHAIINGITGVAFLDSSIISLLFNTSDINFGQNRIEFSSPHGILTGDLIRYEDLSFLVGLPPLLDDLGDFFGRDSGGGGTHLRSYLSKADAESDSNRVALNDTFDARGGFVTSSVINLVAHGFTDGQGPVQLVNFGGELPEGLTEGRDYFIGVRDANNFTLSFTPGGTPRGIRRAEGGGTHLILGAGIAGITSVKVRVVSDFATANPSASWRLGAWSGAETLGFPGTIVFHDQRVWEGGNPGAPQTLYGSRAGGFETWSPTGILTQVPADLDGVITDANGITYTIGDAEQNAIRWLGSTRSLVVGTAAGAWNAGAVTEREAITPTNFNARQAGRKGAADIRPVVIDDRALYVSDTRLKLYSLGYGSTTDSFTADDLTVLSRDITGLGVSDVALAAEPHSTVVCNRLDGKLAMLTRINEQQVTGWAEWDLGGDGIVEGIAVIPSPEGDPSGIGRNNISHSQIWMIVLRTIDGVTKRYWEFFEDEFDQRFDTVEGGLFLDSALTYTGGATTVVQGADHLAGETVTVLADGQVFEGIVVADDGMVTLPAGAEAATPWQIGYPYKSQLKTLRMAVQDPEGSGETKLGRVDHLVWRLDATLGCKFGRDFEHLDDLSFKLIPPDQPTDTVPPLFSGDIEVAFDGGYDTAASVVFEQDQPLPATILSLTRAGQKGARGERK